MAANKNGDVFPRLPSMLTQTLVTGSQDVAREARKLGISVVECKHLDAGKAFLMPEAGLSALPLRTELTVLAGDTPEKRAIGWSMTETIGVSVVNPRGVSRLHVDEHQIVLVDTPVYGCESQRIRAVWTPGGSRAESVRIRDGRRDETVVLGTIHENGFTPSEDPRSYGLRPSGPQWYEFVKEAVRMHVAASVMES